MAQVPVNESTFSRLSVLKARSVIERSGNPVTWDDIVSAACDVCDMNPDYFIESVKTKKGKTRTNGGDNMSEKKELISGAEIKEAVKKGEKVTSEQLEKVNPEKRMVG